MKMNIKKKSQMEAFGLAIIVVMIIIGIFIVVSLRHNNTQPDPRKDYIYDEMASNFVNSIINVHVLECYDNKYTVSDLARSCALGSNIICNGIDSCTLLNSTIAKILSNTLTKQNYAYKFYTEGLGGSSFGEVNIVNRNCLPTSIQGKRGWVDIRLYPQPGDVFVNLDICKT